MEQRSRLSRWSATLILALALPLLADAQAQGTHPMLGGPSGVVKSSKGDLLEGMMIQLISHKTAIRTTVYSDADGRYEFPKLEAGAYTLRIAQPREFRRIGGRLVEEGPDVELALAPLDLEGVGQRDDAVDFLEALDALRDALHTLEDLGPEDVVGLEHQQHELVASEQLARAVVEAALVVALGQQPVDRGIDLDAHAAAAEVHDPVQRGEREERHDRDDPERMLRHQPRVTPHAALRGCAPSAPWRARSG